MREEYSRKYGDNVTDALSIGKIISEGNLTNEETNRLLRIKEAWNFYEGYHWEGLDDLDSAQVTYNYCRPFVNKFVSFEFGNGFTISNSKTLSDIPVTIGDTKIEEDTDLNGDGTISDDEKKKENSVVREKTIVEFLNEVWEDNKKEPFCTELGQTKSLSGEAWIKVQYESPDELTDPFIEYPNGRMRLTCTPTQFVFPEFDDHDKDKLVSLLIMYPIRRMEEVGILRRRQKETTIMYKELWTSDEIKVFEGAEEIDTMSNPYGFIPFVQIKNFPIAGRTYGAGDLDDIIPLNIEYNTKKSDISDIIDYHSAPITCVYGAKIGNLEKGANKVWGGLPKDAKVENLSLSGDLIASANYISDLKTSMCEIGAIPETVLGGASAISNTSGVALQYMNLPLIDRTHIKKQLSIEGIQQINKIILFIALQEGLIVKPENVSMKDFVKTEVTFVDNLPKDELIELQKIETKMKLGLESREGSLETLGVEGIHNKLAEIDKEREEHPELFNPMLQSTWYDNKFNSGMTNGETPVEIVRKEMTGQNGGAQTE